MRVQIIVETSDNTITFERKTFSDVLSARSLYEVVNLLDEGTEAIKRMLIASKNIDSPVIEKREVTSGKINVRTVKPRSD